MRSIQPFGIARLPRIVFGAGTIATAPEEVRAFGERALIVTGARSFRSTANWQRLLDGLAASGVAWYDLSVEGEPTPELVDHAVAEFSESDVKVVIGIGGGSALDAAKAIAGLLPHGRSVMEYLEGVFRNPIYAEGLMNSLRLAVGTTLLAALISIPLAWLNNRYTFPGKKIVGALVLVPMILPPFVGAIGFQQILGQYGVLNAVLGTEIDWLGKGRYMGVIVLYTIALGGVS